MFKNSIPWFQMVWNNVQQLVKHKTYRLLIPLLIFNGFEQGFVYADYNKVCFSLFSLFCVSNKNTRFNLWFATGNLEGFLGSVWNSVPPWDENLMCAMFLLLRIHYRMCMEPNIWEWLNVVQVSKLGCSRCSSQIFDRTNCGWATSQSDK